MSGKAVFGLSSLARHRANAVVGAAGVIVIAVLVLLGVQLHSVQASARQGLVSRFRDRAQVVSALTEAVLDSTASSTQATQEFGSRTVSSGLLDRAVVKEHLAYAVLLDQDRGVIAASRTLSPVARAQVLSSAAVRLAVAGAPVSLSDVLGGGKGGAGVVDLDMSLNTSAGRRVLVSGLPTGVFSAFLGGYLRRIPTAGGEAYVLDSRGNVVGASNPRRAVGQRVADRGLSVAAQRGSSGSYDGGRYFVAVPVSATTWRVVLASSDSSLFSSVSGSRKWLPWIIFFALGVVVLAFLAVLRRLLGTAAALSASNSGLAGSNARLESSNALLRHAAELSRSNAELEQFASIASHDLQEPLRKVQTFAAQLISTENERLSETGQDYLVRMSAAAARMRSLIDDLLMFSRVSTQGRPFVTVDLGEVVEEVLVDLEVSIEDSGAQVLVGELPTVEADPMQMRQLMQNLLGNGLKFCRDGVVPELRVFARVADHIAELTVQDNGIGFDEQYATRIFRAFERLHGARAYPGTGIGLALCRKIVERHNGTITAEAEVGVGATFRVRLPVEQSADPAGVHSVFPEMAAEEVSHVLA